MTDQQPRQPVAHTSVLLVEGVDALQVKPGGVYVDATFGGGGHSREIVRRGGSVIAFDQDERVVAQTNTLPDGIELIHANFSHMAEVLATRELAVDGVLFDLGTSAFQLEEEGRGFSFGRDEPLDMRMSQALGVTARDLVNALGKKELQLLFEKYAQEHRARSIAEAIVRRRTSAPIVTTGELADIVWNVYGGRQGKLHPATKVFQALRIAVNDELNTLEDTLPQAVTILKPGGRLVVISFHEGEDRIVKHFFAAMEDEQVLSIETKKPVAPTERELEDNPRSRSAKMRIATKL